MQLLTQTIHVPSLLYRFLPALYLFAAFALWGAFDHFAARLAALAFVVFAAWIVLRRLDTAANRKRG